MPDLENVSCMGAYSRLNISKLMKLKSHCINDYKITENWIKSETHENNQNKSGKFE